jgi:hypothetical protein
MLHDLMHMISSIAPSLAYLHCRRPCATNVDSKGHGRTIERSKLTVPRIERPRPGARPAGRTGEMGQGGGVQKLVLHPTVLFRQPNSPALMVHTQRLGHVSWARIDLFALEAEDKPIWSKLSAV